MYLNRRQNPNGTFGKCSSAKASDFCIGDRVVQCFSGTGLEFIGRTGTIVRMSQNRIGIIFDRGTGTTNMKRPQLFRKIK